eukprot:scaffold192_cov82-Skeletonema_dohrnii-CCMP3373.AAC.2
MRVLGVLELDAPDMVRSVRVLFSKCNVSDKKFDRKSPGTIILTTRGTYPDKILSIAAVRAAIKYPKNHVVRNVMNYFYSNSSTGKHPSKPGTKRVIHDEISLLEIRVDRSGTNSGTESQDQESRKERQEKKESSNVGSVLRALVVTILSTMVFSNHPRSIISYHIGN